MNIHRRPAPFTVLMAVLPVLALSLAACVSAPPGRQPIATIRAPRPAPPTVTAVPTLRPSEVASRPQLRTVAGAPSSARIEWTSCPFEHLNVSAGVADCGYLITPEDHSQPTGKTIKVFFARFTKANPRSTAAPIFFLTGGPGGSSLETVEGYFDRTFLPFTREHDLIAIDQRGTGHSRPLLDCDDLNEEVSTTRAWQVSLEQCRRRFVAAGVSLDAFTTPQSAADTDLLRQALGYKQVVLWGASYGTTLALMTMRAFPQQVSAAILDGVVPPQVNYVADQDRMLDHAFQHIVDACAADANCDEAYPTLGERLHQLVGTLNQNPVWIPPGQNGDEGFYMNGSDFLNVLFMTMYRPNWTAYIPRIINDTRHRDYYYLSYLAQNQGNNAARIAGALKFNIDCAEELAFTDKAAFRATAEQFAWLYASRSSDDVRNWDLTDMCAVWAVRPIDPALNKPVSSAIPTLLVSSEFDPVTPPEYADEAARTLSHSTNIVMRGGGHSVLTGGNSCAVQVALAFAANPDPVPDASCVRVEAPLQFSVE